MLLNRKLSSVNQHSAQDTGVRTWTVGLLEPEAYGALNVRGQSGVCGNSQSG